MSAGRICTRVIATALPHETIGIAARRMEEYDVGSLVVVAGDRPGWPIGILTDRDIVIRCVAKGLSREATLVSDIMTAPPQCVSEDTPIEEVVAQMARGATRRLVVTGDAGQLVGILSLDDILDLLIEETGAIGRLLERQKAHTSV